MVKKFIGSRFSRGCLQTYFTEAQMKPVKTSWSSLCWYEQRVLKKQVSTETKDGGEKNEKLRRLHGQILKMRQKVKKKIFFFFKLKRHLNIDTKRREKIRRLLSGIH